MATVDLPKTPVENWEAVRDAWVADVERFMTQTEVWAKRQGWGTLRDVKTIEEHRIGRYDVPTLLIHDTFGRLHLNPIARFVAGADGRIDYTFMPSWDDSIIEKDGDAWFLLHEGGDGPRSPWTEEIFVKETRRLASLR